MKICSQCEKENPSSANHCMYCGTALVEEEQLSEEAKLLKKLKEQDEENRLLKAVLDAQLKQQKTQENTQKPASVIEIVAPPTITTEVKPGQSALTQSGKIFTDYKSNEIIFE